MKDSDQLHLVEVEPVLTGRQRFALEAIRKAEIEGGLLPYELGQLWHAERGKHSASVMCEWCGQDGQRLIDELRSKRLVTVAPGGAVPTGQREEETAPAPERPSAQTDDIPY